MLVSLQQTWRKSRQPKYLKLNHNDLPSWAKVRAHLGTFTPMLKIIGDLCRLLSGRSIQERQFIAKRRSIENSGSPKLKHLTKSTNNSKNYMLSRSIWVAIGPSRSLTAAIAKPWGWQTTPRPRHNIKDQHILLPPLVLGHLQRNQGTSSSRRGRILKLQRARWLPERCGWNPRAEAHKLPEAITAGPGSRGNQQGNNHSGELQLIDIHIKILQICLRPNLLICTGSKWASYMRPV